MGRLKTNAEVRQKYPCNKMFKDDLTICDENREQEESKSQSKVIMYVRRGERGAFSGAFMHKQ